MLGPAIAQCNPQGFTAASSDPNEDNVGLWVREPKSGKCAVYLGAASSLEGLLPALDGVACVFVDGTFWSSDELVAQGLSKARAEDMAHLPIGGERGSLQRLAALRAGRKIFTHGTCHADGVLTAEAEGIFITVDFLRFATLMQERRGL